MTFRPVTIDWRRYDTLTDVERRVLRCIYLSLSPFDGRVLRGVTRRGAAAALVRLQRKGVLLNWEAS